MMNLLLLQRMFFACACLCTMRSYAQTGSISGKVTETFAGSTEPVIGAIVNIEGGSKGAATDTAGNFKLDGLEKGFYNLRITYVGYSPKTVKGVEVKEGQNTQLPRIGIEEDVKTTEEVEVIGTRQTGSDVSVLKEIKTLDVVASGISSEQIKRTLDRDAADVAKRVSGVTVVDNRFVVVRGLSDRYNAVTLNDALAPSYEQDVKSFSLDNVQSQYIDRIIIYKSASPDLPGDFAGGVVKIYTTGMPTKNNFSVGLSSSYRQGTTFQEFKSTPQGKFGWLGYDDGSYALPKEVPPDYNTDVRGSLQKYDALKVGSLFSNDTWNPTTTKAFPDIRFNMNGGYRMAIGKGKLLGVTVGVNYSNTYVKWYDSRQSLFALSQNELELPVILRNNLDLQTKSVRFGGLLNVALQLTSSHTIEFKNLYSHTGNTRYRNAYLFRYPSYESYVADPNSYSYNSNINLQNTLGGIYCSQFVGKHSLSRTLSINWLLAFARAERNEPDLKTYVYSYSPKTNNYLYFFNDNNPSPVNLGRIFFKTEEQTKTTAADISKKTALDLLGMTEITLKAGVYIENKYRAFDQKGFGYSARLINPAGQPYNDADLRNTSPQGFNNPEIWNNYKGIVMQPISNDGAYTAKTDIYAMYGMIKVNWREKLTINGGFRFEAYHRLIAGNRLYVQNWLPSINASYNLNKKLLLRGSFGKTVNRPEIREAARIFTFDYYLLSGVEGNTQLSPATVDNFDLRIEFYPKPDEVLSIGIFYKEFNDPIERLFYTKTGVIDDFTQYTNTFLNAKNAYSRGIEVEARKSLRDIVSVAGNDIFKNLSLTANASLLESKILYDRQSLYSSGIDLLDKSGSTFNESNVTTFLNLNRNRSMYGQSPYVINGGLTYDNDQTKTMVNMSYNVMGPRLFSVIPNLGSIYEIPKHTLDITIIQNIGRYAEIKFGIQDILNQKVQFVQDINSDGKVSRIRKTGYPTDFNDPKSIYYENSSFYLGDNPNGNDAVDNINQGDTEYLGFRRGAYYSIGLTLKL